MFMINSPSSQMNATEDVSISSRTNYGKRLSPKSSLTNNANCLNDELNITTKNSFLHVNVPMRPSIELCLRSVSRSNSCPDLSSYFNEMSSSWAVESSVHCDSTDIRQSFSSARLTIQQDLSGLEVASHSVTIETESTEYENLQDSDPTKVMLDWCDCEQDDFAKKKKVPAMSVGSKNHHLGECEPCAFYYSEKECTNGSNCKFCHMCPPGEFKRQKKTKILTVKEETNKLSEQVAAAALHNAYDRKQMDFTEKVVFNINLGSALCMSEEIIPAKTFNMGSQGCDNNFSLMSALGLGGPSDEFRSPEAADECGNEEFRTSRNAFRMRTRRRRHRGAFGSY